MHTQHLGYWDQEYKNISNSFKKRKSCVAVQAKKAPDKKLSRYLFFYMEAIERFEKENGHFPSREERAGIEFALRSVQE